MSQSVIRLAELLQKDELTVKERREGVNLAQAIFGSQSLDTLDSTRTALRQKKVTDVNDPAGVLTQPGKQVVIGGQGDLTPESQQENDEVELAAGEFALNGIVYGEKTDSAGRTYFTKDGKRTSREEFENARKQVSGEAESES